MKRIFSLIWFLFIPVNSCFLFAQQADLKDLIIEIPIKVDDFNNEIYIDSVKFEKINQNKKICNLIIVENLDELQQQKFEKAGITSNSFIPPFISGMKDTIGILISSEKTKSTLIIIVGLNDKNELRCFYKNINEKKYKNFVFYDNEQFIPLKIILENEPNDYILWNPFFEEKEDKILGFINKKETQRFQLILTGGIHSGVSSLKFKPDTSQTINSIYYEAQVINSFNIKFQALYSFKKFLFGTYISYENNNEQNNTRIISRTISSNSVNLDYSGNGNWPSQLLHFGVVATYDLLVFDNLIISPSVNGGAYIYPKTQKAFDVDFGEKTMKEFKQKYSLGGGIYLKLPINENLWFTTGLIYQFNHFDASSYFTDIKSNTFHTRQEIYRIEFGTCLKF